MSDNPPCPCGSEELYVDCCVCYLDRDEQAEIVERLMRSRYTAYTRGREDYLLRTWHPSTRPESLNLGDTSAVRWLGLKILRVEAGGADDSEGLVEFVARHKVGGKASRLRETSRFIREGDTWFYLDGEIEPQERPPR